MTLKLLKNFLHIERVKVLSIPSKGYYKASDVSRSYKSELVNTMCSESTYANRIYFKPIKKFVFRIISKMRNNIYLSYSTMQDIKNYVTSTTFLIMVQQHRMMLRRIYHFFHSLRWRKSKGIYLLNTDIYSVFSLFFKGTSP